MWFILKLMEFTNLVSVVCFDHWNWQWFPHMLMWLLFDSFTQHVVFPLSYRKIKMVDIVTHTMPAENEVHVARNFLTKILRSSMRYCALVTLNLIPSWPCRYYPSACLPLPDLGVISSAMWHRVVVVFMCRMGITCFIWLACCYFHWRL